MGGIGLEVGVGGRGFCGNGNINGFYLGLVDLGFWKWGGGKRVGKGLVEVGFGGEEGFGGSGGWGWRGFG